jgi:N-acetylglucosaminyl-diphospho-decaprenol L-rhamnosyltransferase
MPSPEVTAVIGNYAGEELLHDCIASLRAQTLPLSKIVVVDGASPDRSLAVARELGVDVLERENRGLGYLYNEGARATSAELVLLLNNDVALAEGCLEALVAPFAEESLFATDPRQIDWEGETTVHARTTLRRGRLLREYLPGLHLDHVVPAETTVPTVCANGAAMLAHRNRLLLLGGFDETFFMEWEDLDLCWRAWLRGWPTVYVPAAVVRHRVGAATAAAASHAPRAASAHHNLLRFALKCLPAGPAARVVLGELLRLPRHPRPIALGLTRILRELPEILRQRRHLEPSRQQLDRLLTDVQGQL